MIKDIFVIICICIVWLFTLNAAYDAGAEDGYWEHEAEENLYVCENWV